MSNKPDSAGLTSLDAWQTLQSLQNGERGVHMRDLFAEEPQRFENFHSETPGLLFDYSKHNITQQSFDGLIALARTRGVEQRRDEMTSGAVINTTENRAALHMALRGSCDSDINIGGESVREFTDNTLQQMQTLSDAIRANPAITDIVNIGIGGSDLGPRMAYKALKPFADGPNIYFISNIDGSGLHQRLQKLRPENTLFIIASKTFTTLETMANAKAAKQWLLEKIDDAALSEHLIAVTNNVETAHDFGVTGERILPLRNWIGGRYSLWSGVGLPLAIAIGFERFQSMLNGAKAMDEHFLNAPLEENIPVIAAMLGVWYRNFWNYPAHAVLPYSHDLRDFPVFMQQLDMESNGKSVTRDGASIDYKTGPVIFGESGSNSQHTFMQLLHQSPEIIPADFILFARPQNPYENHHKKLLANALAQSQALMEGQDNGTEPHRNFPGNRPSSTFIFDALDPYHFGMLIALYEHKIFVQGVIWGINSFDQWGVELGKVQANIIRETIENKKKTEKTNISTAALLDHLSQKFIKS